MPLKYRDDPSSRRRAAVIARPSTASKGTVVVFSAIRSSRKANNWERASVPSSPTASRASGPSGVVTVKNLPACLKVGMDRSSS